MLERNPALFGNARRTQVLVAIRLLGETYPSELAAMLGLPLFSVQSIVASFERDAVVMSRLLGRTRLVSLNPRYFAFKELDALLLKLGLQDAPLQSMLASRRRRPRRAGKPGLQNRKLKPAE